MKKLAILFCLFMIVFSPVTVSQAEDSLFLCGDGNGDNEVNLQDIVFLVNYLFRQGPTPQLLESDVNGDLEVGISDVVYLINYLFKSGTEPACAEAGAITGKVFLNGVGPCCNLRVFCSSWWINCPEGDSSYCSVMNPYQGVRVSAFAQGNFVKRIFTDEAGEFYLILSQGTYDIKIYPPQDYIDTSYADIMVDSHQETYLGEPYYVEWFAYQELIVWFAGSVTYERKLEIVQETGNVSIECSEVEPKICVIEVSQEYHPQEMREILLANYPGEITLVEFSIYVCPN